MSESYTLVRKGDTFQGIALENGTSVSKLKKLNHIYGNSPLFIGQKLKVRESSSSSLLGEAARSKSILTPKSQRSDSWQSCRTDSQPELNTTDNSLYSFLSNALWGIGSQTKTPPLSSESPNSPTMKTGNQLGCDTNVSMEDLDSGEVFLTVPLTKSGEFVKSEPQAGHVVVETSEGAKQSNEAVKNTVLRVHSGEHMSKETRRFLDTEFDAELIEVDDNGTPTKVVSYKDGSVPRKFNDIAIPTEKPYVKVEMIGSGRILSHAQALSLATFFPIALQASRWTLLYSVLNHGADLISFYKLCKGAPTTVLVAETVDGDVFGGFASEDWHIDTKFYGSGESFVFKAADRNSLRVFKWSFENHFVMWSNENQIAMGGGGEGFAFALDSDFYAGQSDCSATFNNDPLVRNEDHCFQIYNVEVWRVDSSST